MTNQTKLKRPSKGHYQQHFWLNEYQNFLYKRVMYGLTVYSDDEVSTMHPSKKKRITFTQRDGQRVINRLKQEAVTRILNGLFVKLWTKNVFQHNLIANAIPEPDETYNIHLSFEQLGINKKLLVDRFIQHRVLPQNFYQLTSQDNNRLPLLKVKPKEVSEALDA